MRKIGRVGVPSPTVTIAQPVGARVPACPDSLDGAAVWSLYLPIQRLLQPGGGANPDGWGQPSLPVMCALFFFNHKEHKDHKGVVE